MRTLLSVAIFAMVWCAGFSGDDSFAAERNAPTAKKYASTGSAPYKSFADIVTAAHKKKSDVKSEGNGTSRSSKISYAKTKSPKKIRGLRTGSSSKSLSNKSRSTRSLSASKKRYIKKLSLLKSKGSGKSLKNKSHTRDYSVKPKRSKDRTKRKTIAHE